MALVNRLVVFAVLVVGACSYSSPDTAGDGPNAPPVVAFEFASSGTDEGASGTTGTTALVPVVLNKPSDTTVTVECKAISGGTATELIDYSVATLTVTFPPGVTKVDVEIDVIKDFDEMERAETIELALSSPVGATLDPLKAIHEITIADHVLPRISFTTPTSTTDETSPSSLELVLDLPADGPSTVVIGVTPAATAGTDVEDLALLDGTIVDIPSGAMSVSVPIGEVDDVFDEQQIENVTFELKGASQNLVVDALKRSRDHAITDDDLPPVVQFKLTASDVAEGGATATLEVELSEESQLPVTVTYGRQAADTASADDATVSGTTLSFNPRIDGAAGEKTKSINVTINEDAIDENPETVIVTISAAQNASVGDQATHTLTILADANDPPAVVQFATAASSTNEANTTHTITINVTPASGKDIGLSYAFGGSASISGGGNGQDDYDPNTPSPFTIQAGSATFTFRVDINNDNANEGSETISIQLASPTNATLGATSLHTVTINASN